MQPQRKNNTTQDDASYDHALLGLGLQWGAALEVAWVLEEISTGHEM